MPFRHPDRTADLATRIEAEVRERLEEAVDYVCLEALVQSRRTAGRPAPAADNTADRREYSSHVRALLLELERELTTGLDAQQRRRVDSAAPAPDEESRLMAVQVALARMLPDYWQRFEAISAGYLADPAVGGSRSESRGGLLARLFGRG